MQTEIIQKVEQWLSHKYPQLSQKKSDGTNATAYEIAQGSTLVRITLEDFQLEEQDPELPLISVTSTVVYNPEVNEELLHFLLRENERNPFANFSLNEKGDILLQHQILASHLDQEELLTSVHSVALLADHYDDIIADTWGGKRHADL